MKIAHVSATFPPYQAGTGNVCFQNAHALTQRGHDVHVFTGAGAGAPAQERMVGFTVHRLRPWLQIGNAPLMPALVPALSGFDIIHLHYPFIFGDTLTCVTAATHRTPLVITFHNDLTGDGVRARAFSVYQALSARLVVRSAAALCVVSTDHFQSSRMQQTLGRRHPPVFAVPNTVDCEHFRPGDGASVRQRYGIPPGAPLALFVAALDRAHHFKGLTLLLDVFPTLPDDLWLLVVGDGDLRMQYERQAQRLGAGRRVVFTGAIDNQHLPPYYRCADVTVLPSSPPESFGIVLIESLACGTPVIASDIPGVRTVISNGLDGFLCPAGNAVALASVLTSSLSLPAQTRADMGRNGREKIVAQYDTRMLGASLHAVYDAVLDR